MRDKDYELLNNLLTETLTTPERNFCIVVSETFSVYCYLYDFYNEEEIKRCSFGINRFLLNNNNIIDIREDLKTPQGEKFYHKILRLEDK